MSGKLLKNIVKFHGFSILCGIGILILCTIRIPDQNELPLFPNFDKLVHFTMYFSLSTILILETSGIKRSTKKDLFKAFKVAIVSSFIFGGLIEIIQMDFTTYRSGDIVDWLFDMGGALAACLITGLARLAFR